MKQMLSGSLWCCEICMLHSIIWRIIEDVRNLQSIQRMQLILSITVIELIGYKNQKGHRVRTHVLQSFRRNGVKWREKLHVTARASAPTARNVYMSSVFGLIDIPTSPEAMFSTYKNKLKVCVIQKTLSGNLCLCVFRVQN